MLAAVVLFGLLLVATATDLYARKIYNWTTYSGILAAIGLSAAGLGGVDLTDCLTGFAVCGALMLVCYVLFHVGGGDVKLMAMLGAFLGLEQGIEALLWTFVLGGCSALVLLIWRVGAVRLLSQAGRQLLSLARWGTATPLAPEEKAPLAAPLFLAPCALVATILVRFDVMEVLRRVV